MSKKDRVVGLDPGTAFVQSAEENADGTVTTQIIRNSFVEMPSNEDTEGLLKRNGWNFVKDGEKFYVIGDDSLKIAKLFGNVKIRRPLEGGVLNKGEDKKMLILNEIFRSTLGEAPTEDSFVCICVSSPSADESVDSEFHKAKLESTIENLGWKVKSYDEAFAVILSEKPVCVDDTGAEIPYSGLAMSIGGGRMNIVLCYKGIQVVGFSVSCAGDWVDNKVAAASVGLENIGQVISRKENKLDFKNIDQDSDLDVALDTYYGAMLKKNLTIFASKFEEFKKRYEDFEFDLVVAGGGAMPKNFLTKLTKTLDQVKMPIKIRKVYLAQDPRNAVCTGLLKAAIANQKKLAAKETETKAE